MSEPICGVSVWRYGAEYVCDLRPGHGGPHVDTWEGNEW